MACVLLSPSLSRVENDGMRPVVSITKSGIYVLLLFRMSTHARGRSCSREESLTKEFHRLHRVSGLEIVIGLLLMRRIEAGEESIQDWVPFPQVSLRTTGHRRPATHYWLLRNWSTVYSGC